MVGPVYLMWLDLFLSHLVLGVSYFLFRSKVKTSRSVFRAFFTLLVIVEWLQPMLNMVVMAVYWNKFKKKSGDLCIILSWWAFDKYVFKEGDTLYRPDPYSAEHK